MRCRNWTQFKLLLWKNWLLQKKKKIRTVVIVLLPIFFSFYAFPPRGELKHKYVKEKTYPPFLVDTNLSEVLKIPSEKLILAYAPNTALVARIVNRAATLMNVTISTGTLYSYIVLMLPTIMIIVIAAAAAELTSPGFNSRFSY